MPSTCQTSRPFREIVDLGSMGRPNVLFPTRRDVIRFLYLHEFCHWWLYLTHGWGAAAEIACDRYAYANYHRRALVRPPATRASASRIANSSVVSSTGMPATVTSRRGRSTTRSLARRTAPPTLEPAPRPPR